MYVQGYCTYITGGGSQEVCQNYQHGTKRQTKQRKKILHVLRNWQNKSYPLSRVCLQHSHRRGESAEIRRIGPVEVTQSWLC